MFNLMNACVKKEKTVYSTKEKSGAILGAAKVPQEAGKSVTAKMWGFLWGIWHRCCLLPLSPSGFCKYFPYNARHKYFLREWQTPSSKEIFLQFFGQTYPMFTANWNWIIFAEGLRMPYLLGANSTLLNNFDCWNNFFSVSCTFFCRGFVPK